MLDSRSDDVIGIPAQRCCYQGLYVGVEGLHGVMWRAPSEIDGVYSIFKTGRWPLTAEGGREFPHHIAIVDRHGGVFYLVLEGLFISIQLQC